MPGARKKAKERPWERDTTNKIPLRAESFSESIGRDIKTHIDLAAPIPERLNELIEQLVRRIDEREKELEEV